MAQTPTGTHIVAHVFAEFKPETKAEYNERVSANTTLMAAAPELLEVLENLYTDALDRGETTDIWDQEYDDWRAVRLVIAKAKGEQP